MRNAFVTTLCRLAAEDRTVWLLTADLGYSVLEPFAEQFPERFVNVGIAEQNMIGVAAGLGMSGLTPVAYSIVNFATLRCLEQIRNDICYHTAPVTIVGVGGGFAYGPQGYTHHGLEDLAILSSLPNIDVISPADAAEVKAILPLLLKRKGPAYVRLGKAGEPVVHHSEPDVQRGRLLSCRAGTDLAFIATGSMVAVSVAAAELLERRGIGASVYSAPWIRPFDTEGLRTIASRHGVVATAEEGVVGGLGATVGRIMAEAGTGARLICFGVGENTIAPTLSQSSARRHFGLDAESIANRITEVLT